MEISYSFLPNFERSLIRLVGQETICDQLRAKNPPTGRQIPRLSPKKLVAKCVHNFSTRTFLTFLPVFLEGSPEVLLQPSG